MKKQFVNHRFRADTLLIIEKANQIIAKYRAAGQSLTARQLYYQFIALDAFPDSWLANVGGRQTKNVEKNYKRLCDIVTKGRYAGLIDWDCIEDRTRQLTDYYHSVSPENEIERALYHYNLPKWENQPNRVEIWVEKEALAGIFEEVGEKWDVPFFSCRGYHSASSAWEARKRVEGYRRQQQGLIVLHFGDHDPSGIDMSRDIDERFDVFGVGTSVEIRRMALNMDQINQFNPPPSPAKPGDSRTGDYETTFGTSDTWELDAMDPTTLAEIAENEILAIRDDDKWDDTIAREKADKATLQGFIDQIKGKSDEEE